MAYKGNLILFLVLLLQDLMTLTDNKAPAYGVLWSSQFIIEILDIYSRPEGDIAVFLHQVLQLQPCNTLNLRNGFQEQDIVCKVRKIISWKSFHPLDTRNLNTK